MSDFSLTTLPGGWTVGRFASLDGLPHVRHRVTTRQTLDVMRIRDARAAAAGGIAAALGLRGVAFLDQVHGDAILEVAADNALARSGGLAGLGDGLVTDVPGIGIMCASADCPLVLVAEMAGRAVGVAHASWRSTVKQISRKLIGRLVARYGVDPSRLVACICPSAGPRKYEVGQDVLDAAIAGIGPEASKFFKTLGKPAGHAKAAGDAASGTPSGRKGETPSPQKYLLDLWAANREQLLAAGVRDENIHVAGICTIERNDLFPSYRVEGAKAGRFVAVIALEEGGGPQGTGNRK